MKKVFIYCQAGAVTGGIELLHQLCDVLNNHNRPAYIIYVGESAHVTPAEYENYNIQTATTVEDEPQNTVVMFEAQTKIPEVLKNIKQARIILWWLSVDNYFKVCQRYISTADLYRWDKIKGVERFFSRLIKTITGRGNKFRGNLNFHKNLSDSHITHAYQSEYARWFLESKGLRNIVPLKDFINTEHVLGLVNNPREDIVLYNPAKGMEFTQRLIAAAPEIKWVALRNMTRAQVIEYMRRAKIYIDFGNHPGKDRMPRECAMNGCCIITGKRGAAAFSGDIAIDERYKFDQYKVPLIQIIETIKDLQTNFDVRSGDFVTYRKEILNEKKEFEQQALTLFN